MANVKLCMHIYAVNDHIYHCYKYLGKLYSFLAMSLPYGSLNLIFFKLKNLIVLKYKHPLSFIVHINCSVYHLGVKSL